MGDPMKDLKMYSTEEIVEELNKVFWSNKLLERIYTHFKDCYTAKDFSFNAIAEKLDYQDRGRK